MQFGVSLFILSVCLILPVLMLALECDLLVVLVLKSTATQVCLQAMASTTHL